MQIYTWDQSGYTKAYSRYYYKLRGCGARHRRSCICTDSTISYGRLFFEDNIFFKQRAENIVNRFDIKTGSKIFVVGCAFGYLMEELSKLGMKVWGCDNSQYIQINKNKPAEKNQFDIHNISVLDNNFVLQVKKSTGIDSFDYIITEDVLTSHDEYSQIINNCKSLLTTGLPENRVIHLVDIGAGSPFVSKTYEQWKSINPNQSWVDGFGKVPV